MSTRLRDRLSTLLVLSLFCYTAASTVPFFDAVAVGSPDLLEQITAAAKRPAEVAQLTHEAVSADVKNAAQTARLVTEVVPPLAVVVTAAAVHAAPHRAADIVQAVATATPLQAKKVQAAAGIAATLTANPAESGTIIGAEVVAQPEQAATIVTAAITVCSVLEACPQSTVTELVQAAITAESDATEIIVGAAVQLMPAKSGTIIAAAAAAMAPASVTSVRSGAYSDPRSPAAPSGALHSTPKSAPVSAPVTPVQLGAYSDPRSPAATQAADSSVPNLTKTDTAVQRVRIVPVRVYQPDTEVARSIQAVGPMQSTQASQDTLRKLERTVNTRLPQAPGGRPRPFPASPYQP